MLSTARRLGLATTLLLSSGLAGVAFAGERSVEVLDRGRGERQALRYAPTAGETQLARVSLNLSTKMTIAGVQVPLDLPTIATTVAASVSAVAEDGDITYDYTVRDITIGTPDTPEPIAAPMRDQVKAMVGTRATVRISPSGEIRSSSFEVPPSAPPDLLVQLQKSLRDAGTPLPTEPVGVGARWRLTDQLDDRGMLIERVTTYTVRDLSERTATLDVTVTAIAASTELRDPSLPPGTTASLTSLKGEGQGSLTLDFRRVLPVSSDLTNALDVEIAMQGPGGSQPMSTSTTVKTRIEPVTP